MKILIRFLALCAILPCMLYAVFIGGILAFASLTVLVITGDCPHWPEMAFAPLEKCLDLLD